MVTDPVGRQTGTDASSDDTLDNIPQGVTFSDPAEDDYPGSSPPATDSVVFIPQPPSGTYTLSVTGTTSEAYSLYALAILPDGSELTPFITTGTVTPGSATSFQYNYDSGSQLPRLSISDVTEPKGHSGTTAFDFTVSLSSPPSQPVSFDYSTADDTATVANNDYQSADGSLTFAPGGPLSQSIQVMVNGNTIDASDKTFLVDLTHVTNAASGKVVGAGTIQDDSTPISINSVSELASNSGTTPFAFTVSLAHASTLPVSVDYATADGTATLADGAYQAQAGTLTFNPGQTTQTITILVNGNAQPHGDETFVVNLVNPVNGILVTNGQQGVGTILGDAGSMSY